MRVVAGRLKGRRLKAVPGSATRPTSDRVREALFQILGGELEPVEVLDLFAGTGALGIEAHSRGAGPVLFVEKDARARKVLEQNVEPLGDQARVAAASAEGALRRLVRDRRRFGLVLVDPPYRMTVPFLQKHAEAWSELLHPEGTLVVEHATGTGLPQVPGLESLGSRTYGDTSVSLWVKAPRRTLTVTDPIRLSDRIQRIAPSATLALNQQAQEMKARGEDVIALTAGEPNFAAPEHIVEALAKSARDGETRYTPVTGFPEVREAVAQRYHKYGAHADHVILTAGGKQAIFNAFMSLLNDGDQVLGFAPYWLSYKDMAAVCGAEFVALPGDKHLLPEPERLEAAITDRTRTVVVNSPCNPSGTVIPENLMKGLMEVIRNHPHVVVLSDEIYDRLVYHGSRFVSPLDVAPDLSDRTIIVNGGSKTYAITGLRAGWAVGPRPLIAAMSKLQGQSTSHCAAPVQRALQAALQGPQDFVTEMVDRLDRRRKGLVERLKHIPGVHCPEPKGAFYAFPSLGPLAKNERGEPDTARICEHLLTQQKLVVVPGEPFGAPGRIRLSFAVADDVLVEALDRLATGLGEVES